MLNQKRLSATVGAAECYSMSGLVSQQEWQHAQQEFLLITAGAAQCHSYEALEHTNNAEKKLLPTLRMQKISFLRILRMCKSSCGAYQECAKVCEYIEVVIDFFLYSRK